MKDVKTKEIIVVSLILVALIIVYSVTSAIGDTNNGAEPEGNVTGVQTVEYDERAKEDGVNHIRDKNLLYEDDNEVTTMYLTVRKGNSTDGTDHTWEEINTYSAYYYEDRNIPRYKVEALLQVGDETGVTPGSLGYGRTSPNATVQIRGQITSKNAQKNYKIELKENQGTWNGQRTISLNKNQTEGLRYRNKLAFDLLTGIDPLMSLRTSFVHLYVNDLTDGSDDGFQDYGIYTQVEQLNKTGLKNHGLDSNGHLYKVNFFEFYRYEDAIKLATDPTYDKAAFEKYLEIKGDNDHSKLIAMLEDVNDYSIPIEEVLDKHFDEENLRYWMAYNMLIGNSDCQSRNVYLYSPKNSNTWYFYPWDLDAGFRYEEYKMKDENMLAEWECGVSNYWGNVLFNRCLKSDEFRERFDETVKELKDYLSEERIEGYIADYREVLDKYLYKDPDAIYEPLTREQYNYLSDNLPKQIDVYYDQYLESLEKPLPFFICEPEAKSDKIEYTWDNSFDFDQEEITYHVKISRNPEMTDVVDSYDGNWTEFSGKKLSAGEYFMKVQATNESGYTQDAFDYYIDEDGGKVSGVLAFFVNGNGSITVLESAE